MKKKKNFIIAADDFGKNHQTNERILALVKDGKINRVAIFADGDFADSEISTLKFSGVKLDIHLDFKSSFFSSGKKKENAWKRGWFFLQAYFSGHFDSRELEKEWTRQMKVFRQRFGQYPDGVNSHQHIHFFPPFFKVVVAVAQKFSVKYLRFGRKGILFFFQPVAVGLWAARFFNGGGFKKYFFHSADYLVGLDWIGNMKIFKRRWQDKNVEIVCHPERVDEFELIRLNF